MDFQREIEIRRDMVNEYMVDIFDTIKQPRLRKAMQHLPDTGGKRLRPIFSILSCELTGGEVEDVLPYGVALELIHNFTLVHDDIMDEDDTRRGKPTVHKKFSVATAINAGDGLYSHALDIFTRSRCSDSIFRRLVRELAVTVRAIGEGQQDDMDFEGREDVTVEDYFGMIENKTAKIFELAARGGGLISGAEQKDIEMLGEVGRNYGISFQLTDDYLDLKASSEEMGKPAMSDLRKNKKTLIIVHALERCSGTDRDTLLGVLGRQEASDDDMRRAMEVLDGCGSIDYTRRMALEYANRAKRSLRTFPSCIPRQLLEALSNYNVKRRF